MPPEPMRTDIAVIGAGPVGLFAVFEAGMLGMRCAVLDALATVGGQCAALYPDKPIYDIPGYPRIRADELVAKLEQQAAPFHPTYLLGQPVTALTPADSGWLVQAADGRSVAAKAVLIAAGCGAFGPNRPPLPRLAEFEGRSVFYLVSRREDFRDRRVVIAGGGDSAVDWALSLAELARQVKVVHRRDKFRAAPEMERRLRALAAVGKVELVIPYQLDSLEGDDGNLRAVIVRDFDGTTRRLEADALLALFGLSMDLGPVATWGLELESGHIRVDPASLQTSVAGIYAIGDIARYPGKLKLILSGFSEAAMAAHAIYPRVFPDKALHFEYSTTKGIPAG